VIFGALLVVLMGYELSSIAPVIGIFAVVVGSALIVFAFRTRDRQRDLQE
jgi:uncharacterized membrane protein HdeD (DUF308 family)